MTQYLFNLLKTVKISILFLSASGLVFCSVWPGTADADCAVSLLHWAGV